MEECCKTIEEAKKCNNPNCIKRKEVMDLIYSKLGGKNFQNE